MTLAAPDESPKWWYQGEEDMSRNPKSPERKPPPKNSADKPKDTKSEKRGSPAPKLVPAQPDGPPPNVRRVEKVAPWNKPDDRISAVQDDRVTSGAAGSRDDRIECPCCAGHGVIYKSEQQVYSSWDKDLGDFVAMLENLKIDKHAVVIVMGFLKRMQTDEAYDAVNDLIHNLIKNLAFIENPSAFIVKSISNIKKTCFPRSDCAY